MILIRLTIKFECFRFEIHSAECPKQQLGMIGIVLVQKDLSVEPFTRIFLPKTADFDQLAV